MAKSFNILKEKMSAKAQLAVKEKKQQLLKAALLQDIREAQNITQEELAEKLQTKQANVSRTERRKDLKLSTLKNHIEAMGGELDIVARFPTNEIHLDLKEL